MHTLSSCENIKKTNTFLYSIHVVLVSYIKMGNSVVESLVKQNIVEISFVISQNNSENQSLQNEMRELKTYLNNLGNIS